MYTCIYILYIYIEREIYMCIYNDIEHFKVSHNNQYS